MDILFTDLDNTLIYSKKTDIKKRISVEVYKGEDNSFMSKYSYELLKKLHEKLLIVTVTTRTSTQYERIKIRIVKKSVLCATGGKILKNGESDNEWYLKSLEIIEGSAAERQKAFKMLEKDKRRIFECRNIDDLFIFTKCDDMKAVVKDLKSELNLDLVEVLYNKEKLYIMPKKLNKADTVRRFINEYKGKRIFAAGDTEFDKGMIELADIGFAHKKLNMKNTFNEYEGLFSDYYLTKVYEYTKE